MSARLSFILAVLVFPLLAAAQPLADRVPADAMIYVGWRGSADLGPGYPQSNLKAVMDDTQIQDFIDRFLPEVIDKASQMNPEAGQVGQIVAAIAKPSWQHPTAFFFSGIDLAHANPPERHLQIVTPHFGIIWQPGADGDGLAKQLEQLVGQAPVPFPLKVVHQDDIVALLVGYDKPEAALAGRATKSLADEATFKGEMAHLNIKEPVSAGYVDYERLFGMVDDLIKASGQPDAQTMWPKVRDDLGLKGLKRLVAASGFDGKDFATEAFVDAPEPREGLLNLVGGKPLGEEVLNVIPQTATMAGAARFDLAGLYDVLHRTVGHVHDDAIHEFDKLLDGVKSDSGVDVRKDLLGSLGDEWAYFADPTIGGRGLASLTLVNHLKDPRKFEESQVKIEDYAIKEIQQQAGPLPVHIAFQTVEVDGMTIHYLAVPLVSPSWVVHDGNLYVALFPQVAAGAARHASEHGPSILKSKAFAQVRDRLGQQNPASFEFMDLPRTAPDAYGAWLFVSRIPGIADLFGIKSPPMLMPELSKLLSHLSPAGRVGWADAQGFHMKSIEPFPGSTMVASDPAITALYIEPTLIAVILPSMNRAREQANRVKSASNLRQIGQGAMLYSNEHNGKFPPDLETLYKAEDLTPSVFINPRTGTAPPPPGDANAMARWVQEHGDYVWLGKGKTTAMPADAILAYEKLDEVTDGANVLFGDGHVEFYPLPAARELIDKARAGDLRGAQP
jgi:prepilin-type processing-associated H-X9-DG protein